MKFAKHEDIPLSKMAWVDESALISVSPAQYLLGAVMLGDNLKPAFDSFLSCKPKKATKLHWRSMTDRQKKQSILAIAAINHETIIVSAHPLNPSKNERARYKCLEKLLTVLEEKEISLVTLESRKEALNLRDRNCLLFSRNKGIVNSIDMRHIPGEEDWRLWLPDQILGAYGDIQRDPAKYKSWSAEWNSVMNKVRLIKIEL